MRSLLLNVYCCKTVMFMTSKGEAWSRGTNYSRLPFDDVDLTVIKMFSVSYNLQSANLQSVICILT